jgi:hypothetical protein
MTEQQPKPLPNGIKMIDGPKEVSVIINGKRDPHTHFFAYQAEQVLYQGPQILQQEKFRRERLTYETPPKLG